MDFGLSIKGIGLSNTTPTNSTTVSPIASPSRKLIRGNSTQSTPPRNTSLSRTLSSSPKQSIVSRSSTKKLTTSSSNSSSTNTSNVSNIQTPIDPLPTTEESQAIVTPSEDKPITDEDSNTSSSSSSVPPILSTDDGTIRIRYNHYNDIFTITKGCLSPSIIIEKYCFNYVFKGNYTIHLLELPDKQKVLERLLDTEELEQLKQSSNTDNINIHNLNRIFIGLYKNKQYEIEIIDDPVEKERLDNDLNKKTLNAQELTSLRLGIIH